MDQYTLLEKEALVPQDLEEQYSLPLLSQQASSITREYHQLLVECIILLPFLIAAMFIVGEEVFKVSLDFYRVSNQQVCRNIFLIFLNTMIVKNQNLSKKYLFCQLHVVPIILLQSITHIKFIVGVKQDMAKQVVAKRLKNLFLSM